MARTLDRDRDFGRQSDGALHFQDGIVFGRDDEEVVNHPLATGTPEERTPRKPRTPQTRPEQEVTGGLSLAGLKQGPGAHGSDALEDEPTLNPGDWTLEGPFNPNMKWTEAQKLGKRLRGMGAPGKQPKNRAEFTLWLEEIGLMG